MEQPSDNISQDQARESLIAISEEDSSDLIIGNITTNGVTKANTDDAEKVRSELISISYDESPSPSPVVSVSPTPPNGFRRG
ncbi:unnamed protein product [Cochlearia groenlandica]